VRNRQKPHLLLKRCKMTTRCALPLNRYSSFLRGCGTAPSVSRLSRYSFRRECATGRALRLFVRGFHEAAPSVSRLKRHLFPGFNETTLLSAPRLGNPLRASSRSSGVIFADMGTLRLASPRCRTARLAPGRQPRTPERQSRDYPLFRLPNSGELSLGLSRLVHPPAPSPLCGWCVCRLPPSCLASGVLPARHRQGRRCPAALDGRSGQLIDHTSLRSTSRVHLAEMRSVCCKTPRSLAGASPLAPIAWAVQRGKLARPRWS